jgi:RNA polymerase sigma-70 factor (ECF subfamily)
MAGNAPSDARFSATHWSIILKAKGTGSEAEQALADLCKKYWFPIYAFLRRKHETTQDAEDLTQGFFQHLLARDWLVQVKPEGSGKFRTFLLACLENFVRNEHRDANARKRAPDGLPIISFDAQEAESRFSLEPVGGPDPAKLYEIKWAETLIGNVLQRLKEEHSKADKAELFEALRPHLVGDAKYGAFKETARVLGKTEGATRVAATDLRNRFRELIRAEVAATVQPHEVDQEILYLLTLWGR